MKLLCDKYDQSKSWDYWEKVNAWKLKEKGQSQCM